MSIPPWMESALGSSDLAATMKPISAAESPSPAAYSGTSTDNMSHTPLVKNPAHKVARMTLASYRGSPGGGGGGCMGAEHISCVCLRRRRRALRRGDAFLAL